MTSLEEDETGDATLFPLFPHLVYRGKTDNRQIVVIWCETEGWQKADLEQDKKFVAEKKLTEGADEVFVNEGSFIPTAKALEPLFKAEMFAEVQA